MSSRWVGLIRTSPSLYAGAHGTNPNLQIECVGLENCREFAETAHKADSVNRTMIAQDAASMNYEFEPVAMVCPVRMEREDDAFF